MLNANVLRKSRQCRKLSSLHERNLQADT